MNFRALALITLLQPVCPVFAEGAPFLSFELGGQTLEMPPEAIASVTLRKDYSDLDALDVTLIAAWTQRMADFTQDPQGQMMAIKVCGKLVAEPALQSQILNGRFMLTGDYQTVHAARASLGNRTCLN
ncbi:SecDF P1 head subdomain-containing protein [Cypionkella sp.]|uniref:SecDF P1 head subdomain-containing protein n=1 Tax=Cypionkella sp. TaxID=2811411 RepID=UPI002ABC59D5|nr:hypothetical protein [Cypionkella sp.]MDZ4391883.1 hypothetical protein [Cypionkella sp.]